MSHNLTLALVSYALIALFVAIVFLKTSDQMIESGLADEETQKEIERPGMMSTTALVIAVFWPVWLAMIIVFFIRAIFYRLRNH